MGLFDSIIGSVLGGAGGANSPMAGILTSLLQGQQASGQQGQQPGAAPGGMAGGLGALLGQFQQAGLGQVVQSWISNGPNQQVSPSQIQSALGEGQVQSMANQAGMQPHDFLSQLAQHLPNAVDRATPNGQLPDEGSVSV